MLGLWILYRWKTMYNIVTILESYSWRKCCSNVLRCHCHLFCWYCCWHIWFLHFLRLFFQSLFPRTSQWRVRSSGYRHSNRNSQSQHRRELDEQHAAAPITLPQALPASFYSVCPGQRTSRQRVLGTNPAVKQAIGLGTNDVCWYEKVG